jgi:hypothetical protein
MLNEPIMSCLLLGPDWVDIVVSGWPTRAFDMDFDGIEFRLIWKLCEGGRTEKTNLSEPQFVLKNWCVLNADH